MSSDDFIEFGESNLVPIKDGWFMNRKTGEKIDPDGRVFNVEGEMIFDPAELNDLDLSHLDDFEWWHDDDTQK